MCVLFEFRQFFFYSGNSSTYRSLQKNLIVQDVVVSILEYNINSNSKSAERAKAFWFSEGRTK